MTFKPITFAVLLAAPIIAASAQAPQASDHESEGHRGWLLKAAGALTGAALFSSMIHSDASGASNVGHAQNQLHAVIPTPGGAENPPGNNEIGNDDNVVTTTPEPGTTALLATGLVGLAGMVRRRPRQ